MFKKKLIKVLMAVVDIKESLMTKNKQPTQEQLIKFWTWCGLIKNPWTNHWFCNHIEIQLDLDLNNIFEYAVPKLLSLDKQTFDLAWYEGNWWVHVGISMHRFESVSDNLTMAIFWSIMEVIDGK
jgi:hypothetical protein